MISSFSSLFLRRMMQTHAIHPHPTLSLVHWNRGSNRQWRQAEGNEFFLEKVGEEMKPSDSLSFCIIITRKSVWVTVCVFKSRRYEREERSGMERSYACVCDVCNPLSPQYSPHSSLRGHLINNWIPARSPPGWVQPSLLYTPTPSPHI